MTIRMVLAGAVFITCLSSCSANDEVSAGERKSNDLSLNFVVLAFSGGPRRAAMPSIVVQDDATEIPGFAKNCTTIVVTESQLNRLIRFAKSREFFRLESNRLRASIHQAIWRSGKPLPKFLDDCTCELRVCEKGRSHAVRLYAPKRYAVYAPNHKGLITFNQLVQRIEQLSKPERFLGRNDLN